MPSLDYVLYIVESVLLWCSVLGATSVVITYTYFDELLNASTKLVVYLCICVGVGYASLWLALHLSNGWLCQMVALLTHYLLLCNLAWCCCTAINFYQAIVRQHKDIAYLLNFYHPMCWGIPLIPCIITVVLNGYGLVDGICFIQGEILRSSTFIFPGLVILCTNAILFFFIGREIHIALQSAPTSERKRHRKELRVYFAVFVSVGLTWSLLFVLYMVYSVPILGLVVKILTAIVAPSQGILLFIIYCVNAGIRSKWSSVLVKIGCECCRKYVEDESSTISTGATSPR